MSVALKNLVSELEQAASKEYAVTAASFFKTAPGQYGAGDVFIGIRVPEIRRILKAHIQNLQLDDCTALLDFEIHEMRMAGTLMLVEKFRKAKTENLRRQIFDLYLACSSRINNWDLVDLSAPEIAGGFLFGKDFTVLINLADSSILWERRIAIVATQYFIRRNVLEPTWQIADLLLQDKEDLMHKAVGWMLREAGKKDRSALIHYLAPRYKTMPRTMLRYAIEHFDAGQRALYLQGKI